MKRVAVSMVFVLLATISLAAQIRLDLGVDVPRGIGAYFGNEIQVDENVKKSLATTFFPFPEAALHFEAVNMGGLRVGLGLRAFTLIIETVAWPNVFAEFDLGPVTLEAQAGGGFFLLFGIASSFQSGAIFFPDLSAWYRIGKSFRLGLGALGVFLPDNAAAKGTLPFAFYLAAKAALDL